MIRILIADPDSATRKALTLLLRSKMGNHEIIDVGDLETLIRTLAGNAPDLLLLDWRLYGSPAPDTCRLLQKAHPHLKIILLSVEANDEAAAKDVGAAFIYKGAPPHELISTLTRLLHNATYTNDHYADPGGELNKEKM